MAISLEVDVDVVLLDIGRSVLFSRSLPVLFKAKADNRRPSPAIGHVYRNSADIYVEGTVCPISFVKDILVSSSLYPLPAASVLGFVNHATPRSLSQRFQPDSDHIDCDSRPKTASDHLRLLQPITELEKSLITYGSPEAAQLLPW
jgi:hypothetical protein